MPRKAGETAGSAEKRPRRKAGAATRKARKAPAGSEPTSAPTPDASRGKAEGAARARLRVTQVRSGIGHAATYRRTLTALGLKRHQDEVVVRDHPSVRGMLRKVAHLVRVETVEA
jgi:large subunit ribosomal protein L30